MSKPLGYIKMADYLREQIMQGKYKPGDPSMTIGDMQRRFGYSRLTCAKSMHLLEDEGLLTRVPGHGFYVSPSNDERAEGAWMCGDGHLFRYEPPPSYPPWCGNAKCFAGGFKWIIKNEVTERDWLP